MPLGEPAERQNNEILALAGLGFAGAEDEEAMAEKPAARGGVNERRIDPLEHDRGPLEPVGSSPRPFQLEPATR